MSLLLGAVYIGLDAIHEHWAKLEICPEEIISTYLAQQSIWILRIQKYVAIVNTLFAALHQFTEIGEKNDRSYNSSAYRTDKYRPGGHVFGFFYEWMWRRRGDIT